MTHCMAKNFLSWQREKLIVKNAHSGIRDGQLVCLVIDGKVGIEKNASFILH